jgi:methylmalonyl-CoA mutase
MTKERLFKDFPPVSTETWEEVIHKDLKGADYDKKLIWKTIEGIDLKPYYRKEDLEKLEYLEGTPANIPFIGEMKITMNGKYIRRYLLQI